MARKSKHPTGFRDCKMLLADLAKHEYSFLTRENIEFCLKIVSDEKTFSEYAVIEYIAKEISQENIEKQLYKIIKKNEKLFEEVAGFKLFEKVAGFEIENFKICPRCHSHSQ